MKNNMHEIVAWIACGAAVAIGIIVTDNPLCLFALLIPMFAYC